MGFLKVNGKLVFIPIFVCVGTVWNVCKLWGSGVSDWEPCFNRVLWGPSAAVSFLGCLVGFFFCQGKVLN